jgi:hypothetical protein
MTSKMYDRELSAAVAVRIGALPKLCWTNALEALRTQRLLAGGYYVEGWAIINYSVVEHGWIELPDGRIVDPTHARPTKMKMQTTEESTPAYFAGVRYTKEELTGLRISRLPLVWEYGWGGFKHEPYKQAYLDANRHLFPNYIPTWEL